MEDQLISFETAELAKEKGFNIEGQIVFDLKNNDKIINFKDNAIQEFINDVETGYRDKALYYLKDGINRTDDNTDEGYYILAPSQSLLQKWLREVHNIEILTKHFKDKDNKSIEGYISMVWLQRDGLLKYKTEIKNTYEEALEIGLQEGLKLITNTTKKGEI
jgi:hypothetical protein